MSNFAFGYQNGGGGVSDIKDAYTDENSGNAVVAGDSPYTIVGTGSVRVLVDTSAGEVTINMPASSEAGDQIKIVDVGGNAGTNKITIGSLGTIETDKGSREYRYDGSSFELMEAFKNILHRDADTGEIRSVEPDTLIANSVEAGSEALTDSEDYAGFVNAGLNIDDDGSSFGNTLDEFVEGSQTSYVLPLTVSVSSEYSASYLGWYAFRGDGTNSYWNSEDGQATASLSVDFGTPQNLQGAQIMPLGTNQPTNYTWEGSDNNSDWTVVSTVSGKSHNGNAVWSDTDTFSGGPYRYYRIVITGIPSFVAVGEIRFVQYATTGNNIDTSFTQEDNVTSPSACNVYDENDTVISDGSKVNIQYSLDNGSSFLPGSPISLTAFKALGNIATTGGGIFQARLYPVDDQRISRFDRVGPSVKNALGQNGSSLLVNAVAVHSVDTSGNADFKGSAYALTEGANVAVDGSKGPNFTLQLDDENVTIDNPTNVRIGKKYSFQITQDDVAARTITWGSNFKFAGGSAETLTASVGAVDVFTFESFDGSTLIHVSSSKDIS